MTIFNKEKLYNNEIKNKIEEIKNICSINDIPFFATFCIKNNETNSTYVSEGVATGSRNIELVDDKIVKHLCVQNGFKVLPNEKNEVIDMNYFN